MINTKPSSKLVNLVCFKVSWVVTVYGAIQGAPWLGLLWVLGWITVFFLWQKQDKREWIFLLGCAAIGYILDSVLILTGYIKFPIEVQYGFLSPLWMIALWLNMAATFRYALGWLRNRFFLGAIIGMILGPVAYVGGEKLGGIQLVGGMLPVAIEWLIAIPIILYLEKISRLKVSMESDNSRKTG